MIWKVSVGKQLYLKEFCKALENTAKGYIKEVTD